MKHYFLARRPQQSARSGFTLVELLVVIGVITLLAAITLPVLSRVKESGRRTACSNNMRQLGLAFRQYLQDNGGRFPKSGAFTLWDEGGHWVSGVKGGNIASLSGGALEPAGCSATSTPPCNTAKVELGALYSYVRSPAIYVCPSNQDGQIKKLSYSMNCALSVMGEARIRTPSDIVLLVDEDKANDGFFFAAGDPDDKTLYPFGVKDGGSSTDALAKYHNGGGNLLFVDGHVKFYSFDSFPLDASAEGWKNKSKKDGSPRFHDPAFGPYGSFVPTVSTVTTDGCGINLK